MRIKQTDEEKQILKMIGRNIKFYRIKFAFWKTSSKI